MACLFGHKWNGCKCSKCGKTRDDQHKWSSNTGKCSICGKECRHTWKDGKCEICGATGGVFYVFIAKGESILGNAVMFGNKPSDSDISNSMIQKLVNTYPSAEKMKIINILDRQWNKPESELIVEGMDFSPYFEAIKNHLVDKFKLLPQSVDEAIDLTKRRNLAIAGHLNGTIAIGVPVEK